VKDNDLWRYVTRNVTPYRPQRHPSPVETGAPAPRKTRSETPPDFSPPSPPSVKRAPLPLKIGVTSAMDKRTAQRFKRGDMPVDGRLDLHGLTAEQAHSALSGFIRRSHARGARCVIVVTGKGTGDKGGRIKREAPEWLNRPDLRPLILAVTDASRQHGGSGALYVLLKRIRDS
jgi:DNA-nicking Smr family endonuclease